jgi:hypothetical protein
VLISLGYLLILSPRISNDPELHHKVAGVLVESNGAKNTLPGQYQHVLFFPLCMLHFASSSLKECAVMIV